MVNDVSIELTISRESLVGNVKWQRVAVGVVAIFSAILALFAVGLEGTIVVGSAWLLAAAAGRVDSRLDGAVSWAIAVVAEFGTLFALSATVSMLSPHLHSRWVNLVTLCIPGLLAGAVLLVRRKTPQDGEPHPRTWRVAASIQALALGVALWVATRRPNNGIAWAMSGDARIHVSLMRDILDSGGVTVSALKAVPVSVNAFMALISGAGDRGGSVGDLMAHDARALATTYVLAGIATALMLAGALLEVLPSPARRAPRIGAVWVVLLAVASLAASPFVLGMALADGFVTTYGALPVALAAIVLTLRVHAGPPHAILPLLLVALAAATLLTFVSWTVLVVVPAATLVLTLVVAARALRSCGRSAAPGRPSRRYAEWFAIAVGFATLLSLVVVIGSFWSELSVRLASLGGSARHPFVFMPVALGLLALSFALSGGDAVLRRQMRVPLAVSAVSGITLLWLVYLPGLGVTWTYYALKVSWITCASLFWVPFVPLVRWAAGAGRVGSRADPGRVAVWIGAAAVSVCVGILLGSATTAPEPLVNAADGWTQPSAPIVTEAMKAADETRPFVFWEWSDPGNDRLGNFWAYLAWGTRPEYREIPGLDGGFNQWTYFYQWQMSDLCTLTHAVPLIVVHTEDHQLDGKVSQTCPAGPPVLIEDRS